jgi:mannose-1-phosphate guanylyltransferase
LSQPRVPKQFLTIFDKKPLIIQTLDRVKSHFKKHERLFIVPKELRSITRRHVGNERIVIEPARRNTAAAICLAALVLKKNYKDGVMHVMPADHIIRPTKRFIAALKCGQRRAEQGYLVTYGIEPSRPETGYGYIRIGTRMQHGRGLQTFRSEGFIEKPRLYEAKAYIKSKRYLWNSGIFSFRTSDILNEIENCIPEVYKGVLNYLNRKNERYFRRVPDISIDYGVMEKSTRLAVVVGNFLWDDVGSWLALERYFKKDKDHNILIGNVRGRDVKNSILYTHDIPLKVFDMNGSIVVVSQHGVLVCNKERAQDLKKLLQ